MSAIIDIFARQILDSRGNPTVEVEVTTEDGIVARASVPSGASTGSHEAFELRDGDKSYFGGKSVLKAIDNVNGEIADVVMGMDCLDQAKIDHMMCELDGTENKSRLGANAILGVSLAIAKASSMELGVPLYEYFGGVFAKTLPFPMMNVINGGAHADNKIDIQEFMIVPVGAGNFAHAVQMCSETFHTLKANLKKDSHSTNVGDEGGFAPNLKSADEALDYIVKSIGDAGYKVGIDMAIALDSAASEFYDKDSARYNLEGKSLSSSEMISYYSDLVDKYPIISIEDPLDENDWAGWAELTKELAEKIQIVGDDIFVTNPALLHKGIEDGVANAILIKPNQIGTLTETFETIELAKAAGYGVVISHRSGETEDTTIADIAVACGCGQIKSGSMSRIDRIAKYNQLLRIEEELGEGAVFGMI